VWVGFAEGQISMVPPTTRETVTGGGWPARVWAALMTDILAEEPIVEFEEPIAIDVGDRTGAEPGEPAEGGTDDAEPAGPIDRSRAVPDVRFIPVEPATNTLLRAGLVVEVLEVPDDQYPPGVVVAQEPAPGEARPDDGVIVVRVANGERILRAPDVLGQRAEALVERLEQIGYTVEINIVADSDSDAAADFPGVIWKVEPSAGTPLADDDVLTLWVNPG
jgi:hypothetical protein